MSSLAQRKGGRKPGQETRKPMNDRQVKYLPEGTWRVSPNLWVQVTENGSRSFFQEWTKGGKRHRVGLGSYPAVSLDKAKHKVLTNQRIIAEGGDPRAPKLMHPFDDVVPLWIEKQSPGWTNKRYGRDVARELRVYASPRIGKLDVSRISTNDVLETLLPIWAKKTTLAVRLRGFIEQVLGYAMARGWRKEANPAVWAHNLEHLLPKPAHVHTDEPHPSMQWEEIPAFMATLRDMQGNKFRALELMIHTSLRTSEAAGALWPEIDFEKGLWSLPADRMKKRVKHTVPLTTQAVALLRALPRDSDLVFGPLMDDDLRDAMAATVEASGRKWLDRDSGKPAVPHGFRSTASTWCANQGYEETLIELMLAHAVGTEVHRRYQRSDKVELRRAMMQAWSDAIS